MDDFIWYALVFGVAFYLGYKFNEKIMYFTFSKMMQEAGISNKELDKFIKHWAPNFESAESQSDDPEHIEIRVEKHGEQLYAFRKDNDEFIGQGGDKDALVQRIAERFSNTRFTITKEEGAEFLK